MEYQKLHQYVLRKLEKELPANLYYHGVNHTVDVLDAAAKIAMFERIDETDFILLQTAVLLHDAGYIERYNHNEEVGCEYARDILPGFGYSDDQIETVCRLIMVTEVGAEPQTLLEQIICDADHDYFGRADYKRIALNLYRELAEYGYQYNEKEWLLKQVHFLQNKHKYYTRYAIAEREPAKQKLIQKLQDKLNGR